MSGEKALKLRLQVIAKIKGYADAAQAPELFTTAPALAIPKAISNAGLEVSQIDFYEINEAFSTLVEELKRHLDDRIQMLIGVFSRTYNDDNEDLCIGRKKMRNQDELFCGQMRTRVAGFVRIEEFVAKFMSFYKHNGIKQG